ncbi:hypothetical protein E2C01_052585 [Portunus trituberculatus]|uniref:Uncharacterized protein n=1 Tax=Portunus trituberculatus TaxID=210409 RepID=A0A5B7GNM5_PORTR|nr:hypothetical protein [Portunus trituberculatus]
MATPNPASDSPFLEGDQKCPQNTASPLLNLIFFSSLKQLSEATDSSPFSVPSYFLYPHFCSKAGCCIYVCNNLTCSRAHTLESSEFSTIWLRLNSHPLTKFNCAVYLSPKSSDYGKLFDYLISKVEHILSLYPFAEISIHGDFSVHYQLWLSFPFTDYAGELAFNFAIVHDLEQLYKDLEKGVVYMGQPLSVHYSVLHPSKRLTRELAQGMLAACKVLTAEI